MPKAKPKASKGRKPKKAEAVGPPQAPPPAPKHVAIVAMGASSMDFTNLAAQRGGSYAVADEVWAINAMGGVIYHDRLFAMDDLQDLKVQQEAGKKVAAGMLHWMKQLPGPIYTSKAYPDEVPGAVAYPLEDVLNSIGFPYLNNSVAYAVAYAIHIGVEKLSLYGCDFTYPGNVHVGESGRACVEWLLGIAGAKGMHIEVGEHSTLLDAYKPADRRFYGYADAVVPEFDPEAKRWVLKGRGDGAALDD